MSTHRNVFDRRLLESHKRVQRVNQSLEDKLLLLVDKTETEKNVLNSEISMLTRKIVDQQALINQQNEDNVSSISNALDRRDYSHRVRLSVTGTI